MFLGQRVTSCVIFPREHQDTTGEPTAGSATKRPLWPGVVPAGDSDEEAEGLEGGAGTGAEEGQEMVVWKSRATGQGSPWAAGGAHWRLKVINVTGANPSQLPRQ